VFSLRLLNEKPLQCITCDNTKSVKKMPFIETLYFHLRKNQTSGAANNGVVWREVQRSMRPHNSASLAPFAKMKVENSGEST
jgi:hypothetical protein